MTPFLFALSRTKKCESRSARSESPRRAGSPVGGSILMTSAPSQAEQLRAARPGLVLREIENADAVECLGHDVPTSYVEYAEKRTVVARAL